jgi:hypothetical protein
VKQNLKPVAYKQSEGVRASEPDGVPFAE